MSRFVKVFLLLVLVAGCANPPSPDPFQFPEPTGKAVIESVTIHTVWQNPLSLTPLTTGSDEQTTVNGLQIDGLSDAIAQERINTTIQAQVDAFLAITTRAQLPLMRGLYQRLDEKAILQQRQVYANVTYSLNGVLSVQVNAYYEFRNPQGNSVYVSLVEGLTFDCTTGQELSLADLLINGIDAASRFKAVTAEVLDDLDATEPSDSGGFWFDPIVLVQPFPGVRSTQDFILTDSGIQLILDHRTPEFDTHNSAQTLTIPYALVLPDLALTVRYADYSAFNSPITDWRLFQTQDTRIRADAIEIIVGERIYRVRSSAPRSLSGALLGLYKAEQAHLVEAWTSIVQTYPGIYIEGGLYASSVGPCTCIHASYYAYHEAEVLSESTVTCYDDSAQRLSIDTIFQPDFDGATLLRQALVFELARSSYYHPGFDLDEAMLNLQITLQLDGLSLYTHAHAPGFTDPEYLYLFLSYASIGPQHLTFLRPTP
jgi:hypothetical protein